MSCNSYEHVQRQESCSRKKYRNILPTYRGAFILTDRVLAVWPMTQDPKARNGSGTGIADVKLRERGCLERARFKDKNAGIHRKQR